MAQPKAPYFTSQLVPLFLARIQASGRDAEQLARAHRLPPDAQASPEVRLPLQTFRELSEAAADLVGDAHLGLHVALDLPKGRYGLLEFIARTAPTIGDAFAQFIRFSTLLNHLIEMNLERRGDDAWFIHRIPGHPDCVGRHGNEFLVAYVLRVTGELSGRPLEPRRICFANAAPEDRRPLEEALGTSRLVFAAGENRIDFPAAVLDLPVQGHDPSLHTFLRAQGEQVRQARPGRESFLDGLRAEIAQAIGRGAVGIEHVSRRLGMSARTLQRRLGEHGTAYQTLLDEERQRQARELLENHLVSISEIAFRLGYADVGAFIRAYRRWTGRTPHRARRG